jgi:hypothetical protein
MDTTAATTTTTENKVMKKKKEEEWEQVRIEITEAETKHMCALGMV